MTNERQRSQSPPLPIGALMRFGLHEIRARIYSEVAAAGFDDVRPAHVTLFRWPGPDGRRPTEIATDAQISKQRVNDLLRDLERRGYLRLEPDPTDGRARIVRLSARGRRLHRRAVDAHASMEEGWKQEVGARRYAQMRETMVDLLVERPTSSGR
jgi:DNA-binding MarR family transcriptional regulator